MSLPHFQKTNITPNYYNTLMKELDNMDSVTDLDEEQVIKLKEKFKTVEIALKSKIKPKTITISGPSHNKIREYCSTLNENIGEWCEKILINFIAENPAGEPKFTLNDMLNRYYSRENLPNAIREVMDQPPVPFTIINLDKVEEEFKNKKLAKPSKSHAQIKLEKLICEEPENLHDEIIDYHGNINDFEIIGDKIYLKKIEEVRLTENKIIE